MNFFNKTIIVWLVFAFVFSACQISPTKVNQTPTVNNEWDIYVEQFIKDYFVTHPEFAAYQGKHEFDDKFSDWSEEGLRKEITRLRTEREKALKFKDEQLDARQKFERDYLISEIDKELFWREIADQPHTNPAFYADAIDPDFYVSRPYASLEVRIKGFTAYAKSVPRLVSEIKNNLKMPMARTLIKYGRQSIGGLADFYEKDVAKVFAEVKDEQLQKDFREANANAIKAVREFDSWLKGQEKTATDDFALGAEKFGKMLKMTESVEIDLAKLEEIGKQDLQRNTDALKSECEKFAPGKTIQECMAKAAASKAEGKDLVEAATKQLADLRKFVQEKDVISVPGTEECKVGVAPPYKASNFAYINIPGPYETNLPSVYYVSPPDPSWSKEKQAGYIPGKGSLLFTSVHEGYPGHFLQFLHANRSKSKFGQVFVGYAFAEGWAHYTEEMMYEAGLGANDPELHIGQLQEALLRNVRLLSAIGLHTKGMTVEESKKMFLEKGFQDEGNADQQAERGTYDPAYLNYTMGKLIIRKLREDWTASHGGRSSWKEFHDQFLSYGGPPIPLVRQAMMSKDDKGSLF